MKTILAILAAAAVMIGAAPKSEAGPRFSVSYSSGPSCNSGYSYRSYRAPVYRAPVYRAPVYRHYQPVYRAPRCYTPPVRCYTPPPRYYAPHCRH